MPPHIAVMRQRLLNAAAGGQLAEEHIQQPQRIGQVEGHAGARRGQGAEQLLPQALGSREAER